MRVLNTFSFLLIAGILGCTIADEDGADSSRPVLSPRRRFLSHINTTEDDIVNDDQDMCNRNGGPDAFDTLTFSWGAWETSLQIVSRDVKSMQANDNSPPNTIPNVYELYCGMMPMLETSLRNLTDSFKECLDTDKKDAAAVIYNVTTSVMRFLCENGATRLKDFAQINNETQFSCVSSKQSAIADCADETVLSHMRSKTPEGASTGLLWMAQWFIPDAEKCTVVANFQTCVVKELNKCPPPTPGDSVDSIFNHLKTLTNCNYIVHPYFNPMRTRRL